MSRSCILVVLAVLVLASPEFAAPTSPSAPDDDAAVLAELTRITTILQDAIRTGNREVFARHATERLTLVNRDGKTCDRKAFLDELVPPRDGYELSFRILEPRMMRNGDTALYTYVTEETLRIFGHDVSTKFINHLLYHRRNGEWKLELFTYWEKPSTPPRVAVDAAKLEPLAGTYELVPGKWIHRVFLEGGKLMLAKGQANPVELIPMAGDRFYVVDVEAEYYFERDPSGKTTTLVYRRNWIDLRMGRARGAHSPSP